MVGETFARGIATWKGHAVKKDNSTEDSVGRWTVLFEKRAGKWLIIHEHISTVAEATPLPAKKK